MIEVGAKSANEDAIGNSVRSDIAEDLQISLDSVLFAEGYEFKCEISAEQAEKVATNLFSDPISQSYSINTPLHNDCDWEITVKFNDDVTDNVGHTAVDAVNDLLGTDLQRDVIRTARKFFLKGNVSEKEVERICKELLANEQIESFELRKCRGN